MHLTLTLEFSGGAELLVDKQKKHDVTIESDKGKFTIQVILRSNLVALGVSGFRKTNLIVLVSFNPEISKSNQITKGGDDIGLQ